MAKAKSGLSAEQLEKGWVETIVASLRKFGYPSADENNVFTDYVYSRIFRDQLLEGKKAAEGKLPAEAIRAIDSIIARIDAANKPSEATL